MSLRLIAKDLYRLQQMADRLAKELEGCSSEKNEQLKRQLARTISEKNQIKRILDGRLDR